MLRRQSSGSSNSTRQVAQNYPPLQPSGSTSVHLGLLGRRRQVQDALVLRVGTLPAPPPERDVGGAERHSGEHLPPEAQILPH